MSFSFRVKLEREIASIGVAIAVILKSSSIRSTSSLSSDFFSVISGVVWYGPSFMIYPYRLIILYFRQIILFVLLDLFGKMEFSTGDENQTAKQAQSAYSRVLRRTMDSVCDPTKGG